MEKIGRVAACATLLDSAFVSSTANGWFALVFETMTLAEEAVVACKARMELVAALRAARDVVANHAEFSGDTDELDVMHKADRALAKAEGQQ